MINFEKIQQELIKELEQQQVINIANKNWRELIDINIKVHLDDMMQLTQQKYTPNKPEDREERNEILRFFHFFDGELNTRQAVMQPKYKEDENIAACISCIQYIIRDGMLYLYVFVRSQNIESNFLYDFQTFSLVYIYLLDKYKLKYGNCRVHITSLHKLADS